MRLLLVRHGRPADRESFADSGHSDDLRPLSAEGRRDMRRVARGIAKAAGSIDLLASSPFARAVETAALIARELDDEVKPTELAALAPGGDEQAVAKWLGRHPQEYSVMLVGHEPLLGRIATLFLCGSPDPFVRLKHGGACQLRFPTKAAAGAAALGWLLTPRQFRRLR